MPESSYVAYYYLTGPKNADFETEYSQNNASMRASGQARKPTPRPVPQDFIDHGHRYSLARRIQCLALIAEGFSPTDIQKKTHVKPRTQQYIKKKAYERGFQLEIDPRILEHYVIGGARSGWPKEISDSVEKELLTNIQDSRSGREKSSKVLGYKHRISCTSALRILHPKKSL